MGQARNYENDTQISAMKAKLLDSLCNELTTRKTLRMCLWTRMAIEAVCSFQVCDDRNGQFFRLEETRTRIKPFPGMSNSERQITGKATKFATTGESSKSRST